jgi:hypothetical protein
MTCKNDSQQPKKQEENKPSPTKKFIFRKSKPKKVVSYDMKER